MANQRLLTEKQYAIWAGSCPALMVITYHFAQATGYNKLLIGIFAGAYVVNLFAAMWEFTHPGFIQDDTWKFLVFKTLFYITAFLCPYAAVSVLLAKKFAWYLFALFVIICLIITHFICYHKPRSSQASANNATAVGSATATVRPDMTTDDQVPADAPDTDADAPAAHPPLNPDKTTDDQVPADADADARAAHLPLDGSMV